MRINKNFKDNKGFVLKELGHKMVAGAAVRSSEGSTRDAGFKEAPAGP
jgi:hypothetical protein